MSKTSRLIVRISEDFYAEKVYEEIDDRKASFIRGQHTFSRGHRAREGLGGGEVSLGCERRPNATARG
jgi:hypothetical protein